MKTLTALCVSTALIMGAGIAQAQDVSPARIVELSTTGAILPFEKLDAAALAQHPDAVILDTDLEESYGRFIYQVDVRDAKGQKWEVELDAKTGEVLKNEQDD
ncbi:peptidase [Pseudomonas sp. C27(2019)]|uniref:PepSY domain-containing protein n=1 Tax=Pseudomonas sp. C27(2019) TaxID=2604941 RepID=UPI0012488178|nr:PepSY domain-containing protein [Pseudomonas sp. C27(2019)]QEY58202.1 peptidase [Pseudomonas sp. C27(2019)]